MVTFPLAFPTITGIDSIVLRTRTIVGKTLSPFTFQEQVQVHQGQRWEGSIKLPAMKRASAEEWIAFLLSLNGAEGTLLVGDPNGSIARGSASITPGAPEIFGAAQTGNQVDIDGVPASAVGYLLAGDYIQIGSGVNSHLHKVLQDTDSDSTGLIQPFIWPKLRGSPNDNSVVLVEDTVGTFRLASNTTEWSIDVATFYGIDFEIEESVLV